MALALDNLKRVDMPLNKETKNSSGAIQLYAGSIKGFIDLPRVLIPV